MKGPPQFIRTTTHEIVVLLTSAQKTANQHALRLLPNGSSREMDVSLREQSRIIRSIDEILDASASKVILSHTGTKLEEAQVDSLAQKNGC